MNDFVTDNDRVDWLKRWWDANGTALIIGIVAGLVLIYGWQFWSKQQAKKAANISQEYQVLLNISNNNPDEIAKRANAIIQNYPRSSYAVLSSFVMAKSQVDQQDYSKAYTSLMWVVDHAKEASMRQIARIRAARLLLAMNKPNEALTLLDKRDDPSMNILTDEVRGDIYAVQKNYAEARAAYTKAQNENADSRVLLPILQLKLSSLPNP